MYPCNVALRPPGSCLSCLVPSRKHHAAGAKQLEQHTKSMQAAIPGLFSAIRFVGYIRQQVNRLLTSYNVALSACVAYRRRLNAV